MGKYRSAIGGIGGRARMHALAYTLISRGELVACCARTDGRRSAFEAPEDLWAQLKWVLTAKT